MNENTPDEVPPDGPFPSTLRITSRPFEAAREAGVKRLAAWRDGEDVPHVVNFEDATRLQRVLTQRRLELVENLMEAPADSIRDLAGRLRRDVRQVHDDVQLLAEYGIVRLEADGRAKRPYVPYDTIRIEVELSTPDGDQDRSNAPA